MRQTLVIFSGLPGTGKTVLSQRLARELQIPYFAIDDVVGEIPAQPTIAFWDSKIEILLGLAERQLELGLSVIVDSVFMNTDRHHAQSMARKYQTAFRPIYTFVSDEGLWRERVMQRYETTAHTAADWAQVQRQRAHFSEWEPSSALFVDAANPFEENYASVLSLTLQDKSNLHPLPEIELVRGMYH